MNCRRARKLMHQLLDGDPTNQGDLGEHLAECEACREEMARLQGAHEAAADAVRCSIGEPDLQQEMAGIWQAIAARSLRAQRAPRRQLWLLPASAAAAALLFCLGLWAGRAAWPREVTVTHTVTEPRIIEKRVEVPVVTERVVVKRVPVVRTRVVYRDRVVPTTTPPDLRIAPEPAKAEEVVVRLDAVPSITTSLVSHEIRAVTLAEGASPEARSPTHGENVSDPSDPEASVLVAWQPDSSRLNIEGREQQWNK